MNRKKQNPKETMNRKKQNPKEIKSGGNHEPFERSLYEQIEFF